MSAESWIKWRRGRGDDVRCVADTKTPAVHRKRPPAVYLVKSFPGPTLMVRKYIVTLAELSMLGLLPLGLLPLTNDCLRSNMQHLLPGHRHLEDLE